jgi:hypothetical protein
MREARNCSSREKPELETDHGQASDLKVTKTRLLDIDLTASLDTPP